MTHCPVPEDLNPQQYSAGLAEGYHCICPHNKILFNIRLQGELHLQMKLLCSVVLSDSNSGI